MVLRGVAGARLIVNKHDEWLVITTQYIRIQYVSHVFTVVKIWLDSHKLSMVGELNIKEHK
jgi:hypothetical protein